jgi:RsiW-degrading membrane proteinase PrsW (M82 family)
MRGPAPTPDTRFAPQPTSNTASQVVTATEAHLTLVSLLVLVVVGVFMIQAAGASKPWGEAIIIGLIGLFLILGIQHEANLGNFSNLYPWVPPNS